MTNDPSQHDNSGSGAQAPESTVIGSGSGAPMPFLGENDEGPKVDGYIVESKQIDAGAFGAVFRGRNIQTTRMDAIKVLKPSFSPKLDQERFRREMQTGHLTPNDHIVTFRNAGECKDGKHAGRPYFIMEYLNAGSFKNWLRELDLSAENGVRSAVRILIDVCKGLRTLHEHDIIHRDLKPSNILLGELKAVQNDGCPKGLLDSLVWYRDLPQELRDLSDNTLFQPSIVKIGDFGLVRFADQESDLTTDWLGTPDYMAPEQFVDPTKVTPAADQYAIGIILFQVLTGTKPFPPLEDHARIEEHLRLKKSTPPMPSRSDREVDTRLRDICRRTLSPEPTFRYASVTQLEGSLQAWLDGHPPPIWEQQGWLERVIHDRLVLPTRQNPVRYLSIVAIVTLMLAAGYNIWNRLEYLEQLESRDTTISRQVSELEKKNSELTVAFDEKDKALSAEQAAKQQAIGKDLAQRAARELQPGRNPENALRLAVQAVDVAKPPNFETLEMLSAAMQANQLVCTIPEFQEASWSPTGDLLLCGPRYGSEVDEKYSRALVTTAGETVKRFGYGGAEYGTGKVFWSPDGGHLAVTSRKEKRLELIDAEGNLVCCFVDDQIDSKVVSWSPDGSFFTLVPKDPGEAPLTLIFDLDSLAAQQFAVAREVKGFFLGWVSDRSYAARDSEGAIQVHDVDGNAELIHPPIKQKELEFRKLGDEFVLVAEDWSEKTKKVVIYRPGDRDSAVECSLEKSYSDIVWADNGSIFVLLNEHSWRTFTSSGEPLSQEIKTDKELKEIKVNPIGTSLIAIYGSSISAELFEVDGELVTPFQHFGGQLTISHARNWPRSVVGYNLLGRAVTQPTTPGDQMEDCVWSPNGQSFVSIGLRSSALWDSGGFPITNLDNGRRFAKAVAWSRSGEKLICFFDDSSPLQVRSSEGNPVGVIRGVQPYLFGNKFKSMWSPNDRDICVEGSWATVDKRRIEGVRIYDAVSKPASILSGHFEAENRGVLANLNWAPNSNRLATSVYYAIGLSSNIAERHERRLSRTLCLFSENGEHVDAVEMPRFLERVQDISWRPDGELLAVRHTASQFSTNPDGNGITLLDPNGRVARNLVGATRFAWRPESDSAVFTIDNSSVIFLNGEGVVTDQIRVSDIQDLRWSPDGTLLAVDSGDITLFSCSGATLKKVDHAPIFGTRIIDWSADSRYLFVADRSAVYSGIDPYIEQAVSTPVAYGITRIDVGNSSDRQSVEFPGAVTEFAISPDGRYVASGSALINESPADIYVWEADTDGLTRRRSHIGLRRLAWQPGKQTSLFASAGDDGWVCLWHAEKGLIAVADDSSDISSPVVELAWSNGGEFLATADTTNSVRVWDAHGRKVVSYSQADGPFAIPQMGNSVKRGRQHKEILSQDFFHLAWSHDNRWLAVCNNTPEARVFCFDFPALYRQARERLSIDKPRFASTKIHRSWDPLTEDWGLSGSNRSPAASEVPEPELTDVRSEFRELLRTNHLDSADRLIGEQLSKYPRNMQIWNLRAQLEHHRNNPAREFQSLLLARECGDNSVENLQRMVDLATELEWSSEKTRLLKSLGVEAPAESERNVVDGLLKRLGESGTDIRSLVSEYGTAFERASADNVAEALASVEKLAANPRPNTEAVDAEELALLKALITEAHAVRLQQQRKFDEAAAHFDKTLSACVDLKLPSGVVERVRNHLMFCSACRDSNATSSGSMIDGGVEVAWLVARFKSDFTSPSDAAVVRLIEMARNLIQMETATQKSLLRAAVVMTASMDVCHEEQQARLAEVVIELLVASVDSERSTRDAEYTQFTIADIGPDPAKGYGNEDKAVGVAARRVQAFLTTRSALQLLDDLGKELKIEDKAELLLTVLQREHEQGLPIAEAAAQECKSELLTMAFRLSPDDDTSRERSEYALAARCLACLQDRFTSQDSDPVAEFIALERGRLAARSDGQERDVLKFLSVVFGPSSSEGNSQSAVDHAQAESRYEKLFENNKDLYRKRPFWSYAIIWLNTLRKLGEDQRFDKDLSVIRAAMNERCRAAKVEYELLNLTVQAAMMQIGRDVELDRDTSNLVEEIVRLARRAAKDVPRNSTVGGVPIPGFADFSNPKALEHGLLISIGKERLSEQNLVAAEAIADAVIKYHERSNWQVSDYLSAYLQALQLKVDVLLKKDNPSWIDRADTFNTVLRLRRNDGVHGEDAARLLDSALSLCQGSVASHAQATADKTAETLNSVASQLRSEHQFELSNDLNLRLVAFQTDSQNRRISERSFDVREQPAAFDNGSYGWNQKFPTHEVVRTYVDASDAPFDTSKGYAIVRQRFDDEGRHVSETYFNSKSMPTTNRDGIHGWKKEFDDMGRECASYNVDVDGRPIEQKPGFAYVRKEFGKGDKVISEAFFGAEGPVATRQGYHRWRDRIESTGELAREYFGTGGDLLSPAGIVVSKVLRNSNAERSGLKVGDRILRYNDMVVNTFDELVRLKVSAEEAMEPTTVVVHIERDDQETEIAVNIGELGAQFTVYYRSFGASDKEE